jgi:hypothetical protein
VTAGRAGWLMKASTVCLAVLVTVEACVRPVRAQNVLNVRPLYAATRDEFILREAEEIVRRAALRHTAIRFGMRFLGWVGLAVLVYEVINDVYKAWRQERATDLPPETRHYVDVNGQRFPIAPGVVTPGGCRVGQPQPNWIYWAVSMGGPYPGAVVWGNGATPDGSVADLTKNIARALSMGADQNPYYPWIYQCFGLQIPQSGNNPYQAQDVTETLPGVTAYSWPGREASRDPSTWMPEEADAAAQRPEWDSTFERGMVQRIADRMAQALASHPDVMTLGDAAGTGWSWEPTPTPDQLGGGSPSPSPAPTPSPASEEEQKRQTSLLQEILRALEDILDVVTKGFRDVLDALEDLPGKVADAVKLALQAMFVPRAEVVDGAVTRIRNAVQMKAPWGIAGRTQELVSRISVGGSSCEWSVGGYSYMGAGVRVDPGLVICPIAGTVRGVAIVVLAVAVGWWGVRTIMPRLGL